MMCRSQPLQGHVRAIAIAFMSLTGIVLFCLVLKLAKTNRHNPLANFTGEGRHEVLIGIVVLSIKMVTCGILNHGAEKRKLIYLYPFIIWHILEAVGCIAGVFYGGYLITVGNDETTTWTISVAILSLLCLAILDTWLIYTVISFYQEIRKEAVQNQEAFPVDVEFYSKGYNDIPGRPNGGVDQHNMTGYNEFGYNALPTNDGHQLHHQQRDRTGPMNNKVYDDRYRQPNQYPPTSSKNNQRVSFNLQSNQYLPSNSSNEMLYSQSNASMPNQAYTGHDRPNRNVFSSSHFNYLSFD